MYDDLLRNPRYIGHIPCENISKSSYFCLIAVIIIDVIVIIIVHASFLLLPSAA